MTTAPLPKLYNYCLVPATRFIGHLVAKLSPLDEDIKYELFENDVFLKKLTFQTGQKKWDGGSTSRELTYSA